MTRLEVLSYRFGSHATACWISFRARGCSLRPACQGTPSFPCTGAADLGFSTAVFCHIHE